MIDRLKNLSSFLGAYFNQDWESDYPNMEALVAGFKTESEPWFVNLVAEELAMLIAETNSEEGLAKAFDQLGCYLWPEGVGMTNRQWAEWLLERLKEPSGGDVPPEIRP
jgi:hypothetical protein